MQDKKEVFRTNIKKSIKVKLGILAAKKEKRMNDVLEELIEKEYKNNNKDI